VIYALVSLVVAVGAISSDVLIVKGLRGAYSHADDRQRQLGRRYVRVHLPVTAISIVAAVVIALIIKHFEHPDVGAFFAVWMLSFAGCLIPVFVFVALDARRFRRRS
jgi:hypothetical protein